MKQDWQDPHVLAAGNVLCLLSCLYFENCRRERFFEPGRTDLKTNEWSCEQHLQKYWTDTSLIIIWHILEGTVPEEVLLLACESG